MKISAVILSTSLLIVAIAIATQSHSNRSRATVAQSVGDAGEPPATGGAPPTPLKKWDFRIMRSMAQDCAKPSSPDSAYSTRKCDPGLLDTLPEHSPAIEADGTVYVGGENGLYALNPNGTKKWYYEFSSEKFHFQVPYQPVLYTLIDDNGNIWFDSKTIQNMGGVARVNPEGQGDGVIAGSYRRDTDGFAVTQIGLAFDGSIFVVKQNLVWVLPSDYALKVDGKLTKPYPDGTIQGPSLSGRSYAFAPDNGYYILANHDPSNGSIGQFLVSMSPEKPVWAQALAGRCSAPALGNGGISYVGCPETVLAMYPGGTAKWSFAIRGQAAGQPSIAEDGSVYFACDDGNVYALNPDGEMKWRFRTGDKVTSTPAIARNGTIFFGSNDGYLYAVGPDGKLKWKFKTGGQVYSPTIGVDGTIYDLSADGKLYAIQDLEPNGGLWGQWAKWAGGMHNTWRGPTPN